MSTEKENTQDLFLRAQMPPPGCPVPAVAMSVSMLAAVSPVCAARVRHKKHRAMRVRRHDVSPRGVHMLASVADVIVRARCRHVAIFSRRVLGGADCKSPARDEKGPTRP